ncbi:MAG: hypothetical protein IJM77_07340 [Spirochaetia bacterium]|nr:hypothetical protein [Spirochaetia bacterium]MBQ3648475.1 hypothetical protein [Spirochaetia bacterium]MBQ3712755.1 hypothetical protein [Spirochaetia bacterium]MBQ6674413.1 hypothetical protein [Spirochaetia bacterium]MBQ6904791.1 hypothetical protein [Spirochaetia bacterium]
MTEIDQSLCNELYFLLSAVDSSLSPSLYAFKCQLEKQVYQQFSIQEIERLKAAAKESLAPEKGKK